MKSPYSNPYLSLRARGLYALYVETGRVLSADEISGAVPEGRDAIRAAMKELKEFGYIKAVKHQVNGQWRTILKFTDDGISGVGFPGDLYSYKSIANKPEANSLNSLEVLRTSKLAHSAEKESEGGNEMAWPIDEEKPQVKKTRVLDSDDDSGAVGKIVDKKALRNAKYKKTRFEAVPERMRRHNRPEEDWGTQDLVAEFYDLVREHAPNIPSQVNGQQLLTWINRMVSEGAERQSILKAIRMFFADPRLIRDAGVGQPLWLRFISYYPSVHGIAAKVSDGEVDEDFVAHQEKMLKLLEG